MKNFIIEQAKKEFRQILNEKKIYTTPPKSNLIFNETNFKDNIKEIKSHLAWGTSFWFQPSYEITQWIHNNKNENEIANILYDTLDVKGNVENVILINPREISSEWLASGDYDKTRKEFSGKTSISIICDYIESYYFDNIDYQNNDMPPFFQFPSHLFLENMIYDMKNNQFLQAYLPDIINEHIYNVLENHTYDKLIQIIFHNNNKTEWLNLVINCVLNEKYIDEYDLKWKKISGIVSLLQDEDSYSILLKQINQDIINKYENNIDNDIDMRHLIREKGVDDGYLGFIYDVISTDRPDLEKYFQDTEAYKYMKSSEFKYSDPF